MIRNHSGLLKCTACGKFYTSVYPVLIGCWGAAGDILIHEIYTCNLCQQQLSRRFANFRDTLTSSSSVMLLEVGSYQVVAEDLLTGPVIHWDD